jgi:hypothetical protein
MDLVSTTAEGELSEMIPATRTGPRRMLFIDNIRWTMILLVLSMHATDTYSPFGNWYYTDRLQTTLTTALIFRVLSKRSAGLLHGAAVLRGRVLCCTIL